MPRGVEHSLLDRALQLAHVAGPGVTLKKLQAFRREAAHVEPKLAIETEQKVMRELCDVVGPCARDNRPLPRQRSPRHRTLTSCGAMQPPDLDNSCMTKQRPTIRSPLSSAGSTAGTGASRDAS